MSGEYDSSEFVDTDFLAHKSGYAAPASAGAPTRQDVDRKVVEAHQKLAELKLDIATARISTERGAAIDSFYVSYDTGGKINDPKQQERTCSRLKAAIDQMENAT